MKGNDKLERCLATLSTKELKRLGDYLESPFFRIDPAVREFGNRYLHWYTENGSQIQVGGNEIWNQICPQERFDDGKWRKLRSKFLDVLESCLQQLAWEADATSLRSANLLLRELDQRGLDQDFEQVLEKVTRSVTDEMVVGESDLIEHFRLWEHCYNFHTTRLDPNKELAGDVEFMQQRMKAFRRYVMFDTLKTITGLENRRFMGSEVLSIQIPEGFVDFLIAERQGESPLIKCYVFLLDALEDFKNPQIGPFLVHFLQVAPKLPVGEKSQLFSFAANILIRQYLWSPENEVARRLLELYKMGVQEHILLGFNGLIPANHFKNICVIGCRFKEYEFVSDFITRHREQLPNTDESAHVLTYCEALLLFGIRDFKGCWKRLNEVASKKHLKVEIKSLGIKAQYELGDFGVLESLLGSFERWLQRSNLPALRKEPQLKRIRVLKKIIGLKPGNTQEKEGLLGMIMDEGILDGDWLVEKLQAKK